MNKCECINGYDDCGDKFVKGEFYEYENQGQFITVNTGVSSIWVGFNREIFKNYFKIKENK